MLEHEIQKFFIANKLTLSLAESCSGGGVAAHLVKVPDCSQYFLGSIVSYSRNAKEKILAVPATTLSSFGEVSMQSAIAMAQGAMHQFESDIALAITGIAGPSGGSEAKPVGTIFMAITDKHQAVWQQCCFAGSRETIISQGIDAALNYLYGYTQSL